MAVRRRFWTMIVLCIAASGLTAGRAGADTVANSNSITISGNGTTTSEIAVSGETGVISGVTATITNYSETDDLDTQFLVESPGGKTALLKQEVGRYQYDGPVSGLNLTFADGAPSIPYNATYPSGTYSPSRCSACTDGGYSGWPGAPWGHTMSSLNGGDPNGTWTLYIWNENSGATGSVAGGWSLDITLAPCPTSANGSVGADCPGTNGWAVPIDLRQTGIQQKPAPGSTLVSTTTDLSGFLFFKRKPRPGTRRVAVNDLLSGGVEDDFTTFKINANFNFDVSHEVLSIGSGGSHRTVQITGLRLVLANGTCAGASTLYGVGLRMVETAFTDGYGTRDVTTCPFYNRTFTSGENDDVRVTIGDPQAVTLPT